MKNQSQSTIMLPEGTEVYYRGMYGHVRFVCETYMTVCVQEFPEPVRDVCLIVYPSQYNELILLNGNNQHEQ
jgi:hypothetical protein